MVSAFSDSLMASGGENSPLRFREGMAMNFLSDNGIDEYARNQKDFFKDVEKLICVGVVFTLKEMRIRFPQIFQYFYYICHNFNYQKLGIQKSITFMVEFLQGLICQIVCVNKLKCLNFLVE